MWSPQGALAKSEHTSPHFSLSPGQREASDTWTRGRRLQFGRLVFGISHTASWAVALEEGRAVFPGALLVLLSRLALRGSSRLAGSARLLGVCGLWLEAEDHFLSSIKPCAFSQAGLILGFTSLCGTESPHPGGARVQSRPREETLGHPGRGDSLLETAAATQFLPREGQDAPVHQRWSSQAPPPCHTAGAWLCGPLDMALLEPSEEGVISSQVPNLPHDLCAPA